MNDEMEETNSSPKQRHVDNKWMQRAIELARTGQGYVESNPMVGCVVVKNGRVIGQGYHHKFGAPHAEVEALNNVECDPAGATVYVNLEPCCHHGKTPPCTELLIRSGIERVVIGSIDSYSRVNGNGIEQLKAGGIEVTQGVLNQQARLLNAPFFKLCETGRPWVIAKWAMTLDGKIATRTADSQWISNENSRQVVHELRARMDAIMVGVGTAIADDPMLNARLEEGANVPRVATRVVVDSNGRLPLESKLVKTAAEIPTIVATSNSGDAKSLQRFRDAGCEVVELNLVDQRVDVSELMDQLGQRRFTNVLVEGGGTLLGTMFDLGLIDEVHAFIAPVISGGEKAATPIAGVGVETMDLAKRLHNVKIQQLESDIYLRGIVQPFND